MPTGLIELEHMSSDFSKKLDAHDEAISSLEDTHNRRYFNSVRYAKDPNIPSGYYAVYGKDGHSLHSYYYDKSTNSWFTSRESSISGYYGVSNSMMLIHYAYVALGEVK